MPSRPLVVPVAAALSLASSLAGAQPAAPGTPSASDAGGATAPEVTPIRWTFGAERLRLPAGERMGLLSGGVLFDAGSGWWLGPAVVGAAEGRRGGLFVFGLAVQHRWAWSDRWAVEAGLLAGGGGGAAAPVGGGLMVRPSLQVLRALSDRVSVGVSLSHVRFPSGEIRSTQWGLVLGVDDGFRAAAPPRGRVLLPAWPDSGLGIARMSGTVSQMRLRDGSGRSIRLVGARAEWPAGASGLRWGFESAGAASGGASGYMEVLGSARWRVAPWASALPGLRLDLRGAVGLGGGGAVPTGGGVIGRLAAGAGWEGDGWAAGIEAGPVFGSASTMRGTQAQAWLGVDLDPPAGTPSRLLRTEWTTVLQHVGNAARTNGPARGFSTVGLKLSRQWSGGWYASGQAHAAATGGAGAYAIGLFGGGLQTPIASRWRAGAELLVGAAGGGGVDTGGGALAQALAWAGWRAGPGRGELRLGFGRLRSIRGDLDSPVFELSWTVPFGQTGR